MQRTKIVCTIGPASRSPEVITRLIKAGMDVARISASHTSLPEAGRVLESVREAGRKSGTRIAVMLDLQGPRIRVGDIPGESLSLQPGEEVLIVGENESKGKGSSSPGGRKLVPVDYQQLPANLEKGDRVLIGDGLVELVVAEKEKNGCLAKVEVGGEILSHKGINLPGVRIGLRPPTDKDRSDLQWAIEKGIDLVAVSFVRDAGPVTEVKEIIRRAGKDIAVIAKIEKREAVEAILEIIAASDGIMVARGDLGVESKPEEVPLLQKMIIAEANRAGKPVITATQMLESMTVAKRPTRAEASDVANAVFDGTDAVMLSGETAIGAYPVEATGMMARILESAEGALDYEGLLAERKAAGAGSVPDALSHAACRTAADLGSAAIVTCTISGGTALLISKYRPRAWIIALTLREEVARRMSLYWGVCPVVIEKTDSTDELFSRAREEALGSGRVNPGDTIVLTAGVPVGMSGNTNLLRVQQI